MYLNLPVLLEPGFIKRFELPIISMTGNTASSLAKYSDIVLDTGVSREACPLNLAPTSSTTAMLVMGDALAMALVEARHFTARDFAKRHPGGSPRWATSCEREKKWPSCRKPPP